MAWWTMESEVYYMYFYLQYFVFVVENWIWLFFLSLFNTKEYSSNKTPLSNSMQFAKYSSEKHDSKILLL